MPNDGDNSKTNEGGKRQDVFVCGTSMHEIDVDGELYYQVQAIQIFKDKEIALRASEDTNNRMVEWAKADGQLVVIDEKHSVGIGAGKAN